jgi:hypothetical protein
MIIIVPCTNSGCPLVTLCCNSAQLPCRVPQRCTGKVFGDHAHNNPLSSNHRPASTVSMADPGRPRKQHRVAGDAAALPGNDPRVQRSSWVTYTYTDEYCRYTAVLRFRHVCFVIMHHCGHSALVNTAVVRYRMLCFHIRRRMYLFIHTGWCTLVE